MIVSNFLVMFFWQPLSLALVNLMICITCFLLPIGMQKCPGVSTLNIFQNNLRIAAHNSLTCPPVGICCMLLLRLNSVPLPGKTIQADARVVQRGLLFLFIHWFNEGCCVKGGEIGEEVCSMGKVTREMHL